MPLNQVPTKWPYYHAKQFMAFNGDHLLNKPAMIGDAWALSAR